MSKRYDVCSEYSLEVNTAGAFIRYADGRQSRTATPEEIEMAVRLCLEKSKTLKPANVNVILAAEAPAKTVEEAVAKAKGGDPDLLDINAADRQALIDLPSIGEKAADHILENRPFATLKEALSSLKRANFRPDTAELKNLVTVG